MIHIYYGYGKGKTTSALGAGIRAYGAGMSVLLVQFLKDNKSGELSAVPFDVYEAPGSLSFNPDKSYLSWVNSAVEYVKNSDYDLIILDEMLDIVGDFISVNDAVNLLKDIDSELILTGHKEVKEIFQIADYITLLEKIKHPYDKGVQARKGIEY